MSNTVPLDYQDTAAEIMDEIVLKECPLSEVVERLELAVMNMMMEQSKNLKEAALIAYTKRTTFHMRLSKLRARYGQG